MTTPITLFMLGREYAIPLSTVTVGHRSVRLEPNGSYMAEALILNYWFDRPKADNDATFTMRKI